MPKPYDYEAYFSHGMKPTDGEISWHYSLND